jgi:hypothetical protein
VIHVDGRDWITAAEVPSHWPDVQAATVRAWAYDGKISGYRVGRETYYDLAALTVIEHATRTSRRGNRRTHSLSGAYALHS